MASISSSGFAFDFAIDSQEDSQNESNKNPTASSDPKPVPSSSTTEREPLVWMTTLELQQKLQQECSKEITCHELHLDRRMEQQENEGGGEQAVKENGEQETEESPPVSVLRWIDTTELDSDSDDDSEEEQDTAGDTPRLHANQVVQTGVYEGGLQVWECSLDLVRYLHKANQDEWRLALDMEHNPRAKIMELGCGHALPALYWWRRASLLSSSLSESEISDRLPELWLCDYNKDVITSVTIPNLVLNVMNALLWETQKATVATAERLNAKENDQEVAHFSNQLAKKIHCATGDWMGLLASGDDANNHDTPLDNSMDLMLAAETLYTPQSSWETCQLVARLLKPETGVALLATKRYYFGVGGGSDEFRQHAAPLGLQITTVHVSNDGKSNIREILKVTKPTI